MSLCAIAALCVTGCLKAMIADGQIKGTRDGSAAVQTTADYEAARVAASAGLAQFEGMHLLRPKNEDAYYLLVRGWASWAFAFIEDDLELAVLKGEDDMVAYHKDRARSAYTRAIEYGKQWMESKHEGFEGAAQSGTEQAIVDYLKKFDDSDDADILFWIGQAWMSRGNVVKGEYIGTVYVGKAIIERVVQLKDDIERGSAHVLLGAYHARTGEATLGDASFKASREEFDKAMQINGGKVLLTQVQLAKTWVCRGKDDSPGRKASFALYLKTLNDVLAAADPLPEARLTNAIAKRRARRYASQKWVEDVAREDCGWDLSQAALSVERAVAGGG